MPAPAHIHHAPPPPTEAELATARWEDDGGPVIEPRTTPDTRQWLRIAAALANRLPGLTGREDLIVSCEHGTRSGAPAAFYPALCEIEIDTALFAPHPPPTIHPDRVGDEGRYPVAWGVLVHEAAHAVHSTWIAPPPLQATAVGRAAAMLEEPRIEGAHIARRPADRRFLRASATTLVMPDFAAQGLADRWEAAFAAGLVLARRDAGILTPDETEPVETAVTTILGPDLLNTLAAIWRAALTTADGDGQAMLVHARAWCDALGAEPEQPEPEPAPGSGHQGDLAKAIGEVATNVTANEAVQAAIDAARSARTQAKAAQAAWEREARQLAEKVFGPGQRPFTPRKTTRASRTRSPITGTRPPSPAEKSAAGHLARALRAAAYRERTATVTTSAAPPGRLNMRGALARDAQKAAGTTPTAQPWVHVHRRNIPSPPLRVGIAVDISGSMHEATAPIASAAWIVAKAAALTDPDSKTATVAYCSSLTALTAPGRTPHQVTEFTASGCGHCLAEATDALTAGLGLTNPGAGRLLVIASDGHYLPDEAAEAASRIKALNAAGCAVLWLAFAPDPRPLHGATPLVLADPARAVTAIAKAATSAITNAR
ncbi:hypothetical protein [Streptomyces sp. NPDC003077]|uniref:VWA domain-containing protein n=1 Tax=Streptomyces sp. NPDC003077 TaxID=3154443 RepID=UPI0033A691AE